MKENCELKSQVRELSNEIKQQAYKEILKSLGDKLCDCAIMSDGEHRGYYCSDIYDILRELKNEYENT